MKNAVGELKKIETASGRQCDKTQPASSIQETDRRRRIQAPTVRSNIKGTEYLVPSTTILWFKVQSCFLQTWRAAGVADADGTTGLLADSCPGLAWPGKGTILIWILFWILICCWRWMERRPQTNP